MTRKRLVLLMMQYFVVIVAQEEDEEQEEVDDREQDLDVEDESELEDHLSDLGSAPRSPIHAGLSPSRSRRTADHSGASDDEVFLFDNNIPSIASRLTGNDLTTPEDQTAQRRRNRLLRMISDPRSFRRALLRSVSLHDQAAAAYRHMSDGGGLGSQARAAAAKARHGAGLSTSWGNGLLERKLREVALADETSGQCEGESSRDDLSDDDDSTADEADYVDSAERRCCAGDMKRASIAGFFPSRYIHRNHYPQQIPDFRGNSGQKQDRCNGIVDDAGNAPCESCEDSDDDKCIPAADKDKYDGSHLQHVNGVSKLISDKSKEL